jgi:hypothetical protein
MGTGSTQWEHLLSARWHREKPMGKFDRMIAGKIDTISNYNRIQQSSIMGIYMKPIYWVLIIMGGIVFCLLFLFVAGFVIYKVNSQQNEIFHSRENQDTFFKLVQTYFDMKNIPVEIDSNSYLVKFTNSESNEQVSLTNVAQKCAKANTNEWETIISTNLDQILEAEEQAKHLIDQTDLSGAHDYLSIRIMEDNDSTQCPSIVSRVDLPGTRSILVLDFPTMNLLLPNVKLQSWGVTSEEAFNIAFQNIKNKYDCFKEVKELKNGEKIYGFTADHSFVTSSVLHLEDLPDCIGKHGALVGIPTRTKMLCYPINDEKVAEVVRDFMPAVYFAFKEGPGSITPFMYYYHGGKYETVIYENRGKSFRLHSPNEFLKQVLK